jgi:hypothetical protein
LGEVTVDIIDMMSFNTQNPESVQDHRQVSRADGHVGKRPKKNYTEYGVENDRFMGRIAHENLEDFGRKNPKTEKENFLSDKWYELRKKRNPTLNTIMWKIIEGQRNFLDRHTKLPADSEWLKIAKRNHTLAWTKIFHKVEFDKGEREKWLDNRHFKNPKYPPTRILLWVFTMSSYLYWDLKESTYLGSYDRVDTLGPYRLLISEIFQGTQSNRRNDKWSNFEG